MLVDASALFVHEETLLCLQQTRDWLLGLLVEVEVYITLEIVGIEVVLLYTEWCR